MVIKDRIVSWYIKNVLIPGGEKIDKPGFLISMFTEGKNKAFIREVVLPEELFILIENKFIKTYGEQSRRALYSAGKKSSYAFCSMSKLPSIRDTPPNKLVEQTNYALKFFETFYANKLEGTIDMDSSQIEIHIDKYIICNKNGHGEIMTSGGVAGIWSYVMKNPLIEAVQITCQGNGDSECVIVSAPKDTLEKTGLVPLSENNVVEFNLDRDYLAINEAQKVTYVTKSLKDLMDSKILTYKEGRIDYLSERFFVDEINITFLIEEELKKLPGGADLLFDVSVLYGKNFSKKVGDNLSLTFIKDLFGAFGWGDMLIKKNTDTSYDIIIQHFPWIREQAEKSDMVILGGILSGMISCLMGKDIHVSMKSKSLVSNNFVVNLGS